jgi:hypothetical protein
MGPVAFAGAAGPFVFFRAAPEGNGFALIQFFYHKFRLKTNYKSVTI